MALAIRFTRQLVEALMVAAVAIAFAAIMATVVITLSDIVLRIVSRVAVPITGSRLTWAIPGVVDLSQLLVIVSASFAIPVAFLHSKHVTIDLLDSMLPCRIRQIAGLGAAALSLWLVGACLWYGFSEMQLQREMHTSSATLSIPYIYYWLPLLGGLALSVVAILVNLLPKGMQTRDTPPESWNA